MNRSIVLFHSRNTELHIFDPETMASEDNPYPADLILYLLERGYTGIDINAKSLCNGLGIIFSNSILIHRKEQLLKVP